MDININSLLRWLIQQVGYSKVLNTLVEILSDELKVDLKWSVYGRAK